MTNKLAAPKPDDEGRVDVSGAGIAWRAWGPGDAPATVLLHGAAANWRWWARVVPLLRSDRRIVAFDLSGHGESDDRDAYGPEAWAAETAAVIGAATCGRAALVGHSMGGRVAVAAVAAGAPSDVVVLVDTPLRRPSERPSTLPRRSAVRRLHPTREAAVRAFHLMPSQALEDLALLRDVAESAVARFPGGWGNRADTRVLGRWTDTGLAHMLGAVTCPVAIIRGGASPAVGDDDIAFVGEVVGRETDVRTVPRARHHVMFDDPVLLAEAVCELVEGLRAAVPGAERVA